MLALLFFIYLTFPFFCLLAEEVEVKSSKPDFDPGTKSEGEEDSCHLGGKQGSSLGRTPNHLTLSTTSTLSAGSTGSQAKLIQSSQQPENYQPPKIKDLGKNRNKTENTCSRCRHTRKHKNKARNPEINF